MVRQKYAIALNQNSAKYAIALNSNFIKSSSQVLLQKIIKISHIARLHYYNSKYIPNS